MRYLISLVFFLFLSGCVVMPPSKGINAGDEAFYSGDYEQALKNYESALDTAKQQSYQPHIATAKYGLGRTYGQLCNYDLAEKNLKEAVQLEEEISSGKGVNLSQDYFELARLYYDFGKFSESIIYFNKAIPVVEDLGILQSDPRGYANVLKDYAVALKEEGMIKESEIISIKINNIISENPGKSAVFSIKRFNTTCVDIQ